MVQAFPYLREGKIYQIVEPHPVTLYFNGAQFFLKHIQEWKEKLFLEIGKPLNEINLSKELDAVYTFFSNFSMFTTFLYNSLETFANYAIPAAYVVKKITQRNTLIWDKSQIQRDYPTDRKLWEVLPDALNKAFDKQREKSLKAVVAQLKVCRDDIAHTKHGGSGRDNAYKTMFINALEFDCETAIEAAAEIINFYEPNLIEECGCGSTH